MKRRSKQEAFLLLTTNITRRSECLEWNGGVSRSGYPLISFEGKQRLAHRVTYEMLVGTIPTGLNVCHTCQNPICLNPAHLFAGRKSDYSEQGIAKRFWSHVNKNGPIQSHVAHLGNCWEWTGRLSVTGYGDFPLNNKHAPSHRWSYAKAFGEFDKALWVLHKCDNPLCIRPDHLFLGTALDNARDKVQKGRHWKGGDKQFCNYGHLLFGENLVLINTKNGLERVCKECKQTRTRNYMLQKITVCSECLQASCWQGIFMCDNAKSAGIVSKTRSQLFKLKRENSSYWKTDEQLA